MPQSNDRKCRICECTDFDGCASDVGGCSWHEPDLCSTCAELGAAIIEWYQTAGPMARRNGSIKQAKPALTRIFAEIDAMIDAVEEDLPDPEPTVLIASESDMKAEIAIRGGAL
jgi:hypothetical protein